LNLKCDKNGKEKDIEAQCGEFVEKRLKDVSASINISRL
jgi:hypothetical protein